MSCIHETLLPGRGRVVREHNSHRGRNDFCQLISIRSQAFKIKRPLGFVDQIKRIAWSIAPTANITLAPADKAPILGIPTLKKKNEATAKPPIKPKSTGCIVTPKLISRDYCMTTRGARPVIGDCVDRLRRCRALAF